MNIILFGPYGSGKGTQGKILAEKYNLQVFDTGEQIRYHIKNETDIGETVKAIVNRGDLVPNSVVMEIIQDFIERSDPKKGYLFDGIPRFQEQADTFDHLLGENQIEVKRIMVNIPKDLSLARQLKRNAEATEKREDSTEEIAKKRIEVYHNETLPMISAYIEKGEMYEVDGTQSIEEVTGNIINYLENNY